MTGIVPNDSSQEAEALPLIQFPHLNWGTTVNEY